MHRVGWHGFDSHTVQKLVKPFGHFKFCMALSPSVHWHALVHGCTAYNLFFLGFGQWRQSLNSSTYHQTSTSVSRADLETPCVCGNFVLIRRTAQAVAESRSKSWAIDFAVKTLNYLLEIDWNSLWEWLPNDRQRIELGLKLEPCCLTSKF